MGSRSSHDSVLGRLPVGHVAQPPRVGSSVSEGLVADARVGCEVKIIAKDPLSQVDRVISDLANFAARVRRVNPQSISVAIVGMNLSKRYRAYEGERTHEDRELRGHEAPTATRKIEEQLREVYDELLILPFEATNIPPYPFTWATPQRVELEYGSALTRIGERYQSRFR